MKRLKIMTNHWKGKTNLGTKFLIIVLVGFTLFNLICIEVIFADSTIELKHETKRDNPLKDLASTKLPSRYEYTYNEFELSIDYTIHDILRNGRVFSRLLVTDGGIECGLQGEERPFFKYLLKAEAEIDQITVELTDPTIVLAEPTPYLVPPVLGSNEEISSNLWQGAIKQDIATGWELNHLSKISMDDKRGELHSLKIYPLEFSTDGTARLFRTVKVTYSAPHNTMWLSKSSPDPGHKPTGPVKYLIITHPDLLDSVEPFAQWKSQKGLFTAVVTTEELDKMHSDGDLQQKMRKYVGEMENRYDLDYLLLVGDWDKVPTRNTKNSYVQPMMGEPDTFASDLYFACVDPNTTWNTDGDSEYAEETELDDSIPDMAVGRLAINLPLDVSSVLNGLITREKIPTYDANSEKAVYMAGDPGYMPGNVTEVMDYFWTEYGDDVFNSRETIYHDGSGTLEYSSKSFIEVMSDRSPAMCYFGHGKPNGFPEFFTNSQVPQLKSNGTDGLLFAMACSTSWFDDPNQGSNMEAVENSFAELLTETPNKGVVGFIGASRIAVGHIDKTYSDDAPGLEKDYWRAIREALNGNITPNVGTIWREAITSFASSFYPYRAQGFDNPGLRTFLEYNLLGEPDAPLILQQPETLQLKYELSSDKTSVWAKVTNATGTPVPNVTVSIFRYEELGRAAETNSTGVVTINIPANNGGTIKITAARAGDIPVNDTFNLPDNLSPKPEYELTPEEPDGKNNYYITRPTVKLFGDEPVDVEYRIDDNSVVYSEDFATVLIGDGNCTIHFRAVDSEGQWSAWSQLNIAVDLTPPELFITTDPPEPDGTNGWFITQPIVILNSNEPLNNSLLIVDGGDEVEYLTPVAVSDGVHDFSFTAFDLAGNMNQTRFTVKVDINAPVSTAEISHLPDGENGYYITMPTIEMKTEFEQDIVLEYRWDTFDWQVYNEPLNALSGVHTLYYRGVDLAGNAETEHSMTIKLDSETPVVQFSVEPSIPDGENGFYVTNPLLGITADDADVFYSIVTAGEMVSLSEIVEPVDGSIVIPDGDWSVYTKAVDEAGNVDNPEAVIFRVDTMPPTISAKLSPTSPDGASGWYVTKPTVELTADSPDTQIYWAYDNSELWNEYDNDITLPSGVHKLKFKVVDRAGNIFYNESDLIRVDLDSPEVTILNPEEGVTVSTTTSVFWQGSDVLSGINQYKIRLAGKSWVEVDDETEFEFDGLSSGEKTIQILVHDTAGNIIKVSRSFTVDGSAPTVIYRAPKGSDVFVDSELVVTFSEPMRKDSVNFDIDGISGTITWEGNTAIFIPEKDLEYSSKYKVKVTGSDQYNNSLGYNNWYFKTESEPEGSEASSMPMYAIAAIVIGIIIAVVIVVSVFVVFYKKKNGKMLKKR
jgi:hypothetical protein